MLYIINESYLGLGLYCDFKLLVLTAISHKILEDIDNMYVRY